MGTSKSKVYAASDITIGMFDDYTFDCVSLTAEQSATLIRSGSITDYQSFFARVPWTHAQLNIGDSVVVAQNNDEPTICLKMFTVTNVMENEEGRLENLSRTLADIDFQYIDNIEQYARMAGVILSEDKIAELENILWTQERKLLSKEELLDAIMISLGLGDKVKARQERKIRRSPRIH